MTGPRPGQPIVIGVGNEFRRDDGIGPAVIARLRGLQPGDARLAGVTLAVSDGEPATMIGLWDGAPVAVVIDAVRDPGSAAGECREVTASSCAGPLTGSGRQAASSHAIGLGETAELAAALGRLPGQLTVLAVTGRSFGVGEGLSPEVAAAVEPVSRRVCEMMSDLETRPVGPAGPGRSLTGRWKDRARGAPAMLPPRKEQGV